MSCTDWDDEEFGIIQQGMMLIGWRADSRLTSEELLSIRDIAYEALDFQAKGELTPDVIDDLALKAYNIMSFQIMVIDERVRAISGPYKESKYFSKNISIIDEATICFYRGYYTASLALLFIVLEMYLRSLYGWKPGDKDPSFAQLRDSVNNFPDSEVRDEAAAILSVVYGRYNAQSPPQFLFNRHGMLHGLRGRHNADEMNCVRLFLLFDVLCSCEGLSRGLVIDDEVHARLDVYGKCIRFGIEKVLLYNINHAKAKQEVYNISTFDNQDM